MSSDKFNPADAENVISIGRIFSEEHQAWFPCLKDEKTHDIDPIWVAATMFLLLDRYVSCIPEQHQNGFYDATLEMFEKMKSEGMGYLIKIKAEE
jgi:hypothetical protein